VEKLQKIRNLLLDSSHARSVNSRRHYATDVSVSAGFMMWRINCLYFKHVWLLTAQCHNFKLITPQSCWRHVFIYGLLNDAVSGMDIQRRMIINWKVCGSKLF
jgi:hypothetical protein